MRFFDYFTLANLAMLAVTWWVVAFIGVLNAKSVFVPDAILS